MKKILAQTAHRPWAMPTHPWLYYQEWNHLVFMHARVPVDWLKEHVPAGLTIDTFDGSAWISIVVFRMQRIRPRFLPPVSALSDFGEINIRTYVTAGGKEGVYFLSMEANKKLSCYLARTISGLPYQYQPFVYTDQKLTGQLISFNYEIKEPILHKSAFDLWLTERYCLYYHYRNTMLRYNLHHLEWALSAASITDLQLHYPLLDSLPKPIVPEAFHFSPGVRVAAWSPEKVI
ncbi:hypothetical protein CJD36_020770 [Flavipsychrobacter stenotrophus]|uniref:DUF2071 domain-containing protein n=1 Tax=Flavipsychrobacter stenotrophus TaxID=2077091 RepID=A0A2S7SQX5_9BACT|nr:DUF2071 domain-containing protein [Flavipsychrobacter stenotrophus]PQJ09017.1 hypothetical protein CJD36_020770 [Flavipsychrobacter stenotrophus]